MAEDNNDVLMMFRDTGNQPVPADCLVQLESGDRLADGFLHGKFFEVKEFELSVGLEDTEAKQAAAKAAAAGKLPHTRARNGRDKDEEKTAASFTAWRNNPAAAKGQYPLDLQPFSFSRSMDRASTTFFDYCANSKVFRSASLLKRTIVGQQKGMYGFLRIDFTDVLMIGLDWDDDDVVKEQCKFMARKVQIRYKPQAPDGHLGEDVQTQWDMTIKPK